MSHVELPVDCRAPADRRAWIEGLRHLRRAELASDAARDGTAITAWYDDLGVSGLGEARDRRTDFERLRADTCRGQVREVYARDLSRLFRDLVQQELWFAEMEACGVTIHAQDLPFTPDAATRRLLRQQLGAMHEFQARRHGAIIQAVLRERVAAGVLAGLGHSYWGLHYDRAAKAFAFDPATADRARLVFETFVAEGGAAAAARVLNRMVREEHPRATLTPRGVWWTANLVLLRVRNAVYRRRVVYAGLVRDAPALIPEVVPPALLAEADALLAARRPGPSPTPHRTNARYPYGGHLRCGVCGAPVYPTRCGRPPATGGAGPVSPGVPPPDHPPVTWSCSIANVAAGGGHGGMVSQERLDALVGRALAQAFPAHTSATRPEMSRRTSPAELNHAELNHAGLNYAGLNYAELNVPLDPSPLLAETAARRRRALELYATGLLTDVDALRRRLEALDAQEVRLRTQVAETTEAQGKMFPKHISLIPDAEAQQQDIEAQRLEAEFKQLRAEFRRLWGTSGATKTADGSAGEPSHEAKKRAFLKSAGVTIRLEVHPRAGRAQVTKGPQGGRAQVSVDLAVLGLVGPRALEAVETECERAEADDRVSTLKKLLNGRYLPMRLK